MLRSQVVAPLAWELKLLALGDGFLKNTDALGVGKMHEVGIEHALQTLQQSLVYHLVQEFKVVLAVVQSPTDTVLDKVFLQFHQTVHVEECNLRLYHPELGQVARRVAVLCAERRAEGIDGTQCRGTQLALQLTRHGQGSLLAEEVVRVVDLAIFRLLEVVEVLGRYLEHLTGTLAVAGGDERRVKIEISMLVEVSVDSHRHVVANAHHGTEGVGTEAEMCILAHVLKALSLLLHGIVAAAEAVDLKAVALNLYRLSLTQTLYQCSCCADAGTSGNLAKQILVDLGRVDNNLDIVNSRTIVKSDKIDCFATTMGAHPSLYIHD